MSTDEPTIQTQSFLKKENETNINNLFSDLNFSSGEEEDHRRNSLRMFTLNDILKDDFDIIGKRDNKENLTNSIKNKYKSVQLNQTDLKDINYLIRNGNKMTESKKNFNLELLSIKESSTNKDKVNVNKKENDKIFIKSDKTNDYYIIPNTEPDKRHTNNIKKVIKKNGKMNMNEQADFLNNENLDNIGKKKSNENKLSTKCFQKNDKDDPENAKNRGKTEKTEDKSSSISVTTDISIMKDIRIELTDITNQIDGENLSRIINKKSSIIKNISIETNLERDENKNNPNVKKEDNQTLKENKKTINKIEPKVSINKSKFGTAKRSDIDSFMQTPIGKNSLNMSANQTKGAKNINKNKKFKIIGKEKENLNQTSIIKNFFDKSLPKISSDNIPISGVNNKNQKKEIKNTTNYYTSIIKKSEKPNIGSVVNKTSNFSVSETSSRLLSSKSKKNYTTVSPKIFLLPNNESKTTREENASSSLKKLKTSKHFNKASSLPKNPSPLLEIKESKNEFTIKIEAKQAKNRKINVEEFYNREKDYLEKRKKKIEELTESHRKKELENVLECPSICKTSRKIAEKNTNDFYTRQTTFSNRIDSKIKERVEEQNKKETEMIEKFQQKYKGKKVDMNLKYESLVNWQKLKIEVIKEKQKSEWDTQIKKCTFKPEIDTNSQKIAGIKRSCENTGAITQDTVSRLYKEDILKRKHKNEILTNIYTPTFSPMVYNNKITYRKNNNYLYTLSSDNNNYLNNSFNNNLNNTTCNTVTGLQTSTGNPRNNSALGVKNYNRQNNQYLFGKINSMYSNKGNKDFNSLNNTFYENISSNMRKFKSQNRYMNSRENSSNKGSNRNDFSSNKDVKDNKLNVSFQSEKKGDGKVYYKSFFNEAAENPRDLGNMLKERFQNVFKKYNL